MVLASVNSLSEKPRPVRKSSRTMYPQTGCYGLRFVSHRSDCCRGRAVANTSVLSSSSTAGAEPAGIEQMIDMTVVVDIAAANAGGIPQTDGRGIVSSHIESNFQR